MSLVRFKTGLEDKPKVESMTVFNSSEVDTKKQPMFFGINFTGIKNRHFFNGRFIIICLKSYKTHNLPPLRFLVEKLNLPMTAWFLQPHQS